MSTPQIVLHHYAFSPYAEKIRLALGIKGLAWGSVEVEVTTPENARVVMTAARPYDPESPEARFLRESGIEGPDTPGA